MLGHCRRGAPLFALFLDLKKAGYGENGVVELYLAQVADEILTALDARDGDFVLQRV